LELVMGLLKTGTLKEEDPFLLSLFVG